MLRVLIVDDDWVQREILAEMLATAGLEICAAALSSDEAISMAQSNPPDVLIADVRLAGGVALAAAIQAASQCGLIFLGRFMDTDTREGMRQAQASVILLTPVVASQLVDATVTAAGIARARAAARSKSDENGPDPAA